MKNSLIKVIKMTLIAVFLVCSLVACGEKKVPSGSYEGGFEFLGQSYYVTYTFKGSNVEVAYEITFLGTVITETAEGTYEIVENDDGSLELTIDFEEDTDYLQDGTCTYEEGDGYIILDYVKYTKVEK